LDSRGGLKTKFHKWFKNLQSDPRSRRGKYVQPEAYIGYFEDSTFFPNADIGFEGRF
jgi:hypothetical protein